MENNNQELLICKICHKKYDKIGHLSYHVNQFHKIAYKDYYDKHFKAENEGKCRICGIETKWNKGKYSNYCSNKCQNNDPVNKDKNSEGVKASKSLITQEEQILINNKRNQTCLEKYGVENVSILDTTKEKVKNSSFAQYGDWFLNTKECKDAFKKKYGADSALEVPEILERVQKTNLERYGYKTPAQNLDIINKSKKNKNNITYQSFERFKDLIIPAFTSEEFTGGRTGGEYCWKCSKCGDIFKEQYLNGKTPRCLKCFPINYRKMQTEISDFLATLLKMDIKQSSRLIISNMELDIFVPEKNIAIEFNGLYWHSELNGKDRQYHLKKTIECEKKNIRLIQIFQDEWTEKRNIVQSRLKHIYGTIKRSIYARKCEIKEIDTQTKNKFLNKYHIQGEDVSGIKMGAFYKNRLVAVMTFSKFRKALGKTHKEDYWELNRFCTIFNFNIIGIGSKLLTYFERTYNPTQIISYADRRWSQGHLYDKLGFTLDHISKPSYWYLPYGCNKRIYRFNYRKNILKNKLEHFDNNLSEWQNMQNNKFDRIWDCGNLVYIKNYPRKKRQGPVSTNP